MRKVFHQVAAAAFGTLAVGLGVSLVAATAASATTGTVVFNSASNTLLIGTNLPSTTPFNLGLGSDVCSFAGNAGEQYFSFLVPAATDITPGAGGLTYSAASAPEPDQGAGLTTSGGEFVPATNAENTPAGGINAASFTGLEFADLLNNATFDYVVQGTATNPQMPSGNAIIPSGATTASYEAGVSCQNANDVETDAYYCQVTFTAVPVGTQTGQDPNGFVWTPSNCSGTGPVVPEAPLAIALPLGGLAVLSGAVFINRRRRRGQVSLAV